MSLPLSEQQFSSRSENYQHQMLHAKMLNKKQIRAQAEASADMAWDY
jgi:hypothetical protein